MDLFKHKSHKITEKDLNFVKIDDYNNFLESIFSDRYTTTMVKIQCSGVAYALIYYYGDIDMCDIYIFDKSSSIGVYRDYDTDGHDFINISLYKCKSNLFCSIRGKIEYICRDLDIRPSINYTYRLISINQIMLDETINILKLLKNNIKSVSSVIDSKININLISNKSIIKRKDKNGKAIYY